MKDNIVRKGLVFGIIVLFIGVGVQPSIATVQPENSDVEYFDVKTEFIGLGKEYTTQLTKEDIEELDALFDSINERLNKSTSMKESVDIFKEAVFELDSYGLLGNVGIKETEKLVTNNYQNPKLMKILEKVYNRKNGNSSEDINILCLIAGKGIPNIFFYNPFIYIPLTILGNLFQFLILLLYLGLGVGIIWLENPLCLARSIYFYDNAKGEIISFGLLGLKYWNGSLEGLLWNWEWFKGRGVLGFTGLKIQHYNYSHMGWDSHFLGVALLAHIKDS